MSGRARRGQAMLEYVLALAGIALVVAVMGHFLVAASRSSDRAKTLVSSEYP